MSIKKDTILKKKVKRWSYNGKVYFATDKTDLRRKLGISHSNTIENRKIKEIL